MPQNSEFSHRIIRRLNSSQTNLYYFKNYPSFPYIPTPMSASWIMFTSFAPSPTESVIFFNRVFTSLTTSAFYLGVTRQQMTDLHFMIISSKINMLFSIGSIYASASPSIKSPQPSLIPVSKIFLTSIKRAVISTQSVYLIN